MKARHAAQRQKLIRRTFLKAVGLGLAAPLAYKMSQLAVAAPGDRPTRLFIWYLPHGVPVEHFEPGDDLELNANGIGILSPLEPYKSLVSVVRGVTLNDGANNHAAIRALLTGFNDGAGANSIDFTVAQALGVQAHMLGVVPNRGWGLDADSRIVKHGDWVTPTANPADAVEDLFAGLGTTEAPTAPVDEGQFRQAALGLTERELEVMQRELSGLTTEENKLALHLEAVQALKSGGGDGGAALVSCDSRPVLPSVDAMVGKDPFVNEYFGTVLDGHFEAAAHAFLCGTARVITLQTMYANAQVLMNFPGGPGFAHTHHDPLSHGNDDSSDTSSNRYQFAETQKWFFARFAEKFLSVLAQPDPADPEHTVLDNMVIMVCSEIGDGNLHNGKPEDIWLPGGKTMKTYPPFILIGGGGGYLKTGHAPQVPVMHTDILATVAAAMGAPISTIGAQSVSVPEVLRA